MQPAPNTIVDWLTQAGPYAVTLILLIWLYFERRERLDAQRDAKTLRTDMVTMTKESTTAMGQFGEAMRTRMAEHDERIDQVLERLDQPRRGTR